MMCFKEEVAERWTRGLLPYFYQVFQGDEYLRGADLICARGFVEDAYRKVTDPLLFFPWHSRFVGGGKAPKDRSVPKEKGEVACFSKYFMAFIGPLVRKFL